MPRHREPAFVFPFTRTAKTCFETYTRHSSSLRALASLTIFPSHYRKNGHFQTSAPALLKHSLSFTLQLFSFDHPPHADFDVMCHSCPKPRLAVPSLSSGFTKRPFSIASPMHSGVYLLGRSCIYTYRALYRDRPTHLVPIQAPGPQAEAYTPRSQPHSFRFSHSGPYRTQLPTVLCYKVPAPHLLSRG